MKSVRVFFSTLTLTFIDNVNIFDNIKLINNIDMALIAYYPFTNGSLQDYSGSGASLALVGNVTYDPERGGCMYFGDSPSNSNHYTCTGMPGAGDPLSIFAWVKLSSFTSDRTCVSIGCGIYLTVDNIGRVSIYNSRRTPTGYHNSDQSIELNKWYLVGAAWDDKNGYIYINNELVKTIPCTGVSNPFTDTRIGREGDYGRQLCGKLSDFRVYSHILSQSELDEIYGIPAHKKGLIAHWPLTGTLDDYSGNGNVLSNHGAVVSDNGKIGKCYDFGARKSIRSVDFKGLQSLTITAWIYSRGGHHDNIGGIWSNHNHLDTSNFTFFSRGDTGLEFNAGFVDGTRSKGVVALDIVKLNEWTHVAAVYEAESKTFSIYVNGRSVARAVQPIDVKVTNYRCTIGQWAMSYIDNYQFNGKLNDVRVYDYALSNKEIKEVSKAKILHYNFNEFQEPTENILGYNNISPHGCSMTEIGSANSSPIHKFKVTNPNTGNNFGFRISEPFKYTYQSSGFTISFMCKVNVATDIMKGYIEVAYTDGATERSTFIFNPTNWYSKISNDYTRVEGVAALNQGKTVDKINLLFVYRDNAVDADFDIHSIQLESKLYATPFTPNNAARPGLIRDMSGFKNNAQLQLATTPRWTVESRKGSGCYDLLRYKHIDTNLDCNVVMQEKAQSTLSCWLKLPTVATDRVYYSCILGWASYGGFGLFIDRYNKVCAIYRNVNNIYATPCTISVDDGKWHHISSTLDLANGTMRIYHNGGLIHTSAISYSQKRTDDSLFNLNNHTRGMSGDAPTLNPANIMVDDPRLYATALSASDIKELYQTSAEVDNKGNMFVNEIFENKNIAYDINRAIIDQKFENGLSRFQQPNCNVTLTDSGYRIYRDPNLIYGGTNRVMWGGFLAFIPEGTFVHGRKYRISWEMKGVSSNALDSNSFIFARDVGWRTLGQTYSRYGKMPKKDFSSDDYEYFYGVVECTNSEMYKVATNTDNGTVIGQTYYNWKQLKIGYTYDDTGSMGTDVFIRNFKVEDITFPDGVNSKGQLITNNIAEAFTPGITQIRLTDGSVASLECKYADKKIWAKVFHHNNKSGTVLFSKDNNGAEAIRTNITNPVADKFSILGDMELFRGSDSKFEFRLEYPTDAPTGYNRWKQSSLPTESIAGYEVINLTWNAYSFGGLVLSSSINTTNTKFDCTPGTSDNWYYAIGCYSKFGNGIPSYSSTASIAQLWVAIEPARLIDRVVPTINQHTATVNQVIEY